MKNKNSHLDAAFATKTDTVKQNRGGIRDYSEVQEATRVRGEFVSGSFNPKVTLSYKTITFNPSCVRFFSDHPYVTIYIDAQNRRLFVKPVIEDDAGKLKIAHFKNGKPVAQTCTTGLCPILFNFMKWDANAKYRILPKFEGWDTEIMILPLDDAMLVEVGK